jgi:hypothetical protein
MISTENVISFARLRLWSTLQSGQSPTFSILCSKDQKFHGADEKTHEFRFWAFELLDHDPAKYLKFQYKV